MPKKTNENKDMLNAFAVVLNLSDYKVSKKVHSSTLVAHQIKKDGKLMSTVYVHSIEPNFTFVQNKANPEVKVSNDLKEVLEFAINNLEW